MDVPVFIQSENASSERRLDQSWTIETLKQKLYSVTGIPPNSQALSWQYTSEDQILATLQIEPYSTLHVTDVRPKSQRENYTDASHVEKFELSPEEYEQRTDSVLAFKKRNQLGRFDPHRSDQTQQTLKEAETSGILPGARCKVGQESDRRGTVRYVGLVPEIPSGGVWVGVEYDEPVGKNDGSVQGSVYFKTQSGHGGFLRPAKVIVGDFPVKDIEDEIEMTDDEI